MTDGSHAVPAKRVLNGLDVCSKTRALPSRHPARPILEHVSIGTSYSDGPDRLRRISGEAGSRVGETDETLVQVLLT